MSLRLSVITTVLLLMFSCGSQNAEKNASSGDLNNDIASVSTDAVDGLESGNESGAAIDKVVYLNKATFIEKVWDYEKHPDDWVYKGSLPCIVDFYADWCAPCRRIAPILDELAKEYAGQIIIYKIDTDKERELASVFQVRGIPSILYVPMQGKPQMQSGAFPKDRYQEMINTIVLQK